MRVIGLVVVLLLIISCSSVARENSQKNQQKKIGIPNPASVKCHEDGHKLEIRTGEGGGQIGICIDENGKECDEWAYFRGECKLSTVAPR